MRNSNHRAKPLDAANDLYRAFTNLDRSQRRTVALRILGNQRLLADLYDHLLIQRALEEGGRSISWRSYQRSRRSVAT